MPSKSVIVRNLIPIISGHISVLVIGVFGLKLVSQHLSPAVYGTYAIFLTLTQVGPVLSHAGLINLATRYWQREAGSRNRFVCFLWSVSFRRTLYLLPICLAIGTFMFIKENDIYWVMLFPVMAVGAMGLAIIEIAASVSTIDQKYWRTCFIRVSTNAARIFLPLGFVVLWSEGFLTLGLGFLFQTLLCLLVIVVFFHPARMAPQFPSHSTHLWWDELRDYGRPFFFIGIGGWLLMNADRWIVEYYFGNAEAGQFALATNLGTIAPAFVLSILMQLVFPIAYKKADCAKTRGDWLKISVICDKATLIFIAGTLAGLFMIKSISPYLVGWLIDAKYEPAVMIMFAAGLSFASSQVNQFQYLLIQGQHNSQAVIKVISIIAGVKTMGGIIAAYFSYDLFLNWLVLSFLICAGLGRWLIRRAALGNDTAFNKTTHGS